MERLPVTDKKAETCRRNLVAENIHYKTGLKRLCCDVSHTPPFATSG